MMMFDGISCKHQETYDGRVCVLKEFNLHDDKETTLFRNEVKRLRALQHACVVSVEATFVCETLVNGTKATFGFIQMPFYEGGDLARWLTTDEHIRSSMGRIFSFMLTFYCSILQ